MIGLRCFTCIMICLNLYMVVMGDLRKLTWALKQNEKERLLKKFLTDTENQLMHDCPSRQTSIIAPDTRFLRAAIPIFKGRPYFIGTDSKVMVRSREYAEASCVLVFIDTIDHDYLFTIFSYLPNSYHNKVQIVSTNHISDDEVNNIFNVSHEKAFENVILTFLDNNLFKAFQAFRYTRNCRREIRLFYIWTPDGGSENYRYDDDSPRNLNKCSVPISTLPTKDSIIIREYPNGSLNILGGLEGNIILTFAEKLNFTAAVKYPEIRVRDGKVNNTVVGLLGDIVNKKSEIAIGKLLSTSNRIEICDITASYNHECILWITPIITSSTEAVLYSEFRVYLWAAILSSIVFSCVFVYHVSRISPNDRVNKTCTEVTLDVISYTLGIPLHRVPDNQPGRIYYISYILYVMVMTAAYRTSLASILTVRNNGVQLIKNDEDIVRWGLIPGGNNNSLSFLRHQLEENSYMHYLAERYEVVVDFASALNRIKRKKDFAYIRHLSAIQYYKRNLTLSGEEIFFYSFDYCILSYHSVVLVSKGSALTKELSRIIISLNEFGFTKLWNSVNENLEVSNAYVINTKIEKLTLPQLLSIFLFYLSGIVVSIAVLILEMIFRTLFKRNRMTH